MDYYTAAIESAIGEKEKSGEDESDGARAFLQAEDGWNWVGATSGAKARDSGIARGTESIFCTKTSGAHLNSMEAA